MTLMSIGVATLVVAAVVIFVPLAFRTVVDTNRVHIVQTRKRTISYGTGQEAGNVYYQWPSWLPVIGLSHIDLPVNNFALSLQAYHAYDKDRVPFELDVTAFFRIKDTNIAAQRVASFEELHKQLVSIVQGAVRKILASHDINAIMVDRATFGTQFTTEVATELEHWGVEPVKNMELMDIRDAENSKVIVNIMAKKSSQIEMESRREVAHNKQAAETAEIEAQQTVLVRQQEAQQVVGERNAQRERAIGVANERASQEVKGEAALTMAKSMEIARVEQVQQAEIHRAAAVVAAEQNKQTTVLEAEGRLSATRLTAEGVQATGVAEGEAERARQMAPVSAQIALAQEIGSNDGYQSYLIGIKTVEAFIEVGSRQAEALSQADVKIIASAGDAGAGIARTADLFTPRGGLAVGSALEALHNTPQGAALLDSIGRVVNGGAKPNGAAPSLGGLGK
jgi:flotillin